MKLNKFIWIFFAVILFISCNHEETLEGSLVNLFGNAQRSNNYEEWGDFYRQYFVSEKIDSKDSSGIISPILALSSWQFVFSTVNGSIVFVDNKSVKWETKLDPGFVSASGMVADKNQNIYLIDNNATVYSFDLAGKLRWKKSLSQIDSNSIITFSDLLAVDDGILISSTDGILKKFGFDGKILWSKDFGLPTTDYFSADDEGNIYFPLTQNKFGGNDSLLSINNSGKINWKKTFSNTRIIKPPVLFEDKIYLNCIQSTGEDKLPLIHVINKKDGKTIRSIKINQTPRFLSVDSDGNLYVIAYDGGFGKDISMLACWDKNGKKLWDKYFEVTIPYPVMISSKSLAFVGIDQKATGIYFLSKEGLVQTVISLSEAPNILLQPTVAPGNLIVFGGVDKLELVYIDDAPMKKYIPW